MIANINSDIPIIDRLLTAYSRKGWRGSYRIWRLLQQQEMKPFVKVYNKYGIKLLLSPLEYIDSFVILAGYYESEVLEAILPFLGRDSVFWDVGANFGLHSITAKYLKPQSKVICIEPSPVMIARLHANARLNNVSVDVVDAALTDSRGFRYLHIAEDNAGMTTLKPLATASYPNKVLCWSDTGDNLVESRVVPAPTVIKLDVEGSEVNVLRGLKKVLGDSSVRAIVVEADPNLLIESDSEIYSILTAAGFHLKMLTRNERTKHHLENFIAVRN
jgi:FkbM family methyltransferase